MKKALIMNVVIFILEVLACFWMASGFVFHTSDTALSAPGITMLKYFTVDSNILMGICAMAAAMNEWKVLTGKKQHLDSWVYTMKLVGTVGVTLTMLITIFFLTPTTAAVYGWFGSFKNSNFFLHLLNPILSIYVFVFFEKSQTISFKHTFTGIVPMLVYSVYYVAESLIHSSNNVVGEGYDWYGFFVYGTKSAAFILPILILVTYFISFVLWKWNRNMERGKLIWEKSESES